MAILPVRIDKETVQRSAPLTSWIHVGAWGVNPTLARPLTRSVDAGGRRPSVRVDRLIAKPDPVLVEPSQGLVKERWLRVTRRHGSFHDVELVFVHVNPHEGAGFVGVAGKVQLLSFNEVREVVPQVRHLGISLQELKECIDSRASHIMLPVPLTRSAGSSTASFKARGAGLGPRCEYSLGMVVIDHRHRVAILALRGAIDARRQIGAKFRAVDRFRYRRLTREIASEAILPARKLNPFLGERRPRHGQDERCRNEWSQAHIDLPPSPQYCQKKGPRSNTSRVEGVDTRWSRELDSEP